MKTELKSLIDVAVEKINLPQGWDVKIVKNDDNLTYCLMNHDTKEAVWVDPMIDDEETHFSVVDSLKGYQFIAVVDTHTHADHISNAARLAEKAKTVLIMHEKAPSRKINLTVRKDTALPTRAGLLELWNTPGHTHDGITLQWGPFLCTGDTIIFNDTGRNDLPTGNPDEHYETLQKIKKLTRDDAIFLTGHDQEARISTWKSQLKTNPTLSQDKATFVKEAGSYVGPSPKLLKESLFENFK